MEEWLVTLGSYVFIIVIMIVYSITLWKDNPAFRFVQYIGIGVTAGNATVLAVRYLQDSTFAPLAAGNIALIIPIILGLLLFARFTPYRWLTRYSTSVLVGISTGLFLRGTFTVHFLANLRFIIQPTGRDIWNIILNLVFAVSIIGYYIVIRERTGPLKYVVTIGRWAIAATLGSIIGRFILLTYMWLYAQILNIMQTIGVVGL